MSQTESNQAKAQRKWATNAMATQRTAEAQVGKVAPALNPKVPTAATTTNTAALKRNKVIHNVLGSAPSDV